MSLDERREFTDSLKHHDMVLPAVYGTRNSNLIHPDESIRREYLKNLISYIELAESLGCPAVPTMCGTRAPQTPEEAEFPQIFAREYRFNIHPDNWSLPSWKLLVESIQQVLRDTSGMKASIAILAQITTTIDSPLAHRRLLDDVADPRLGVVLDPVNMVTLNNYYRTTELIDECFELLGESILLCHAKDTRILPNSQTLYIQEVCPGRGELDWETYLARMSRLDWPRMLFPEHLPNEQYPEGIAFIRKTADKVGVKVYG